MSALIAVALTAIVLLKFVSVRHGMPSGWMVWREPRDGFLIALPSYFLRWAIFRNIDNLTHDRDRFRHGSSSLPF